MSELWQNAAIGLAVGSALVYLTIRVIRRRRKRQACSECRLMQAVTGKDQNSSSGPHLN